MANLFWADVNSDPKRRFRFTLQMGGVPIWTIKTATKPKVNVGIVEHQFINHTFKYPGRVTWDNITITLVDPVQPDLSKEFYRRLQRTGYQKPTNETQLGTISKKGAYDALSGITIAQLDAEGKPIETWTLKNAWIVSVDFGGNLDYAAEEMNEITLEIAYDWAEIK